VKENGLVVPRQIFEMLARIGVSTAEEFIGAVYAFPLLIAGELGWKMPDVWRARDLLAALLPEHMTARLTAPEERPRQYFGARAPYHEV
ncbi:MAG: hypothetical protein U1A23_04330, partial [Candidatus Sungbacteria bacterium]|nr:hypothetical protein [Candidatus Sungbacteria bacterium]